MDADVIVLGGGPGGATTAQVLASHGVRVLVIEKDRFPRFHIGESLLSADLPIFARLGVSLDGAYLRKEGAEFWDERTGRRSSFLFREGLPGTPPHAYQVERAHFDHLLLERARACGAIVHEGERATDVDVGADAVTVTTSAGRYRARFFVDATGQDAFLARRGRDVIPLRDFGIVAAFRHFDGLSDAVWSELSATGNIRVLLIPDGWVWLIPLAGRRLSCGVVTRKQGASEALLEQTIADSPMIGRLAAGTTRTAPRVIRNFSYRNARTSGARFGCVGDSSLFLDPVFSSGVSLAMFAGERTAAALAVALAAGTEAAPDLLAPVAAEMRVAYTTFAALVGSFYQRSTAENLFFAPDPDPTLRAGLISILAGDVFRDDNPMQNMLAASTRHQFDPFAVTERAAGSTSS